MVTNMSYLSAISKILACEIEASIFENHVIPALKIVESIFDPRGWELLPLTPTKDMIEAGQEQWHRIGTATDAWKAMYGSCPDPESVATP